MKAFDADVLSELFRGTSMYVERAALIPSDKQAVTIIVIEEMLRGRLNVIRQAESDRAKVTIERAYDLLHDTVNSLHSFGILPYDAGAESIYQGWRKQRIRIGAHDLRIAANFVTHQATILPHRRQKRRILLSDDRVTDQPIPNPR
jgi:tRNA(fMet)-specific endonuclease VapC